MEGSALLLVRGSATDREIKERKAATSVIDCMARMRKKSNDICSVADTFYTDRKAFARNGNKKGMGHIIYRARERRSMNGNVERTQCYSMLP